MQASVDRSMRRVFSLPSTGMADLATRGGQHGDDDVWLHARAQEIPVAPRRQIGADLFEFLPGFGQRDAQFLHQRLVIPQDDMGHVVAQAQDLAVQVAHRVRVRQEAVIDLLRHHVSDIGQVVRAPGRKLRGMVRRRHEDHVGHVRLGTHRQLQLGHQLVLVDGQHLKLDIGMGRVIGLEGGNARGIGPDDNLRLGLSRRCKKRGRHGPPGIQARIRTIVSFIPPWCCCRIVSGLLQLDPAAVSDRPEESNT